MEVLGVNLGADCITSMVREAPNLGGLGGGGLQVCRRDLRLQKTCVTPGFGFDCGHAPLCQGHLYLPFIVPVLKAVPKATIGANTDALYVSQGVCGAVSPPSRSLPQVSPRQNWPALL